MKKGPKAMMDKAQDAMGGKSVTDFLTQKKDEAMNPPGANLKKEEPKEEQEKVV